MKQMNRLLRRYGTKRFEELLASVKLGELLDRRHCMCGCNRWYHRFNHKEM